jgi:hypothetical protein
MESTINHHGMDPSNQPTLLKDIPCCLPAFHFGIPLAMQNSAHQTVLASFTGQQYTMATTTALTTVTSVTALVEKMTSVLHGTDGGSIKDFVSNDIVVGDVVFGTTSTLVEKYDNGNENIND